MKKTREYYGILAGSVGIIINLLLFLLKLSVGIITNSVSIMADAFNNATDSASSVISILGFKLSAKAPDRKHPFGYGKAEYLAGLFISVMIFIVGIEFVSSSINKILNPEPINISFSIVILLLISILAKIFIGIFNYKLGVKINSTVLKAVMQDSINDCITTSVVIVSMIFEKFTGYKIDGYVGLLVAIFILYSGFNLIKDTISPLIGQGADPDLKDRINKTILSFDHILSVHDLIIHNYGEGKCLASVHVEVPDTMDIITIHNIVDAAEKIVFRETSVYIVIHIDPVCTNDSRVLGIKADVEKLLLDDNLSMHDFRITDSSDEITLIFDMVVPFNFTDENEKNIITKIKRLNPKYNPIIQIDRE